MATLTVARSLAFTLSIVRKYGMTRGWLKEVFQILLVVVLHQWRVGRCGTCGESEVLSIKYSATIS
jgi:hypothetical protein